MGKGPMLRTFNLPNLISLGCVQPRRAALPPPTGDGWKQVEYVAPQMSSPTSANGLTLALAGSSPSNDQLLLSFRPQGGSSVSSGGSNSMVADGNPSQAPEWGMLPISEELNERVANKVLIHSVDGTTTYLQAALSGVPALPGCLATHCSAGMHCC